MGDVTGRLRALNGHFCHPCFGPRKGPRCLHHPWVDRGCNVRTLPHYHHLHCHGLPQSLVLSHRHRQRCPYAFGFGLHVVPRVCWGRPQCTVRSYSVQHALALSSFTFVDTDVDVLMSFWFCMRAMSIYLKVRLRHFGFYLRDRVGVRHSWCVSFAPLGPCVGVSSAAYILNLPPTVSLVLSVIHSRGFGCL